MGGKEGSTGYLLQAITCVLDSLRDDKWIKVKMESKVSEKVDIEFVYESNISKVIQVKSSINQFSEKKISEYIIQLINDFDSATFYKLLLIGTCDYKTKTMINDINKIRKQIKDKQCIETLKKLDSTICKNIEKIEIEIINNDINMIEDSVSIKIAREINNQGYEIDMEEIDSIMKTSIYDYFKTSTNDKYITKEEFRKMIITNKMKVKDKNSNLMLSKLNEILLQIQNNPRTYEEKLFLSEFGSFSELILERLKKRIEVIQNFYAKSYSMYGFGDEESLGVLNICINDMKILDKKYEFRVDEAINRIKSKMEFVAYRFEEYLEIEKEYINKILFGVKISQQEAYEIYGKTYHLLIREILNNLICKYNELGALITNKLGIKIESLECLETLDDEILSYNCKEDKINGLASKINTILLNKKYKKILVCSDNDDEINKLEDLTNSGVIMFQNWNKSLLSQEEMYNSIEYNTEAFDKTGSFSPQINPIYVIFTFNIDDTIKKKMEKLKNRATIKYIFSWLKCEA